MKKSTQDLMLAEAAGSIRMVGRVRRLLAKRADKISDLLRVMPIDDARWQKLTEEMVSIIDTLTTTADRAYRSATGKNNLPVPDGANVEQILEEMQKGKRP